MNLFPDLSSQMPDAAFQPRRAILASELNSKNSIYIVNDALHNFKFFGSHKSHAASKVKARKSPHQRQFCRAGEGAEQKRIHVRCAPRRINTIHEPTRMKYKNGFRVISWIVPALFQRRLLYVAST